MTWKLKAWGINLRDQLEAIEKLIDDLTKCSQADEDTTHSCQHKQRLVSFILRAREIKDMEVKDESDEERKEKTSL